MSRAYVRRYTYQELSDRTGLPISTIRYYKRRRLLPPPHEGPTQAGVFGEEHIDILCKIRDFPDRSYSLDDIRDALYPDPEG